jgi:hypothetical protein
LKIDLDSNITQPGEENTFQIEAHANSFVALLAVDRKSTLMKSENDINRKRIREAINSMTFSNIFNLNYSRDVSAYRTDDFYNLLADSNAYIMTDARDNKVECIASDSRLTGFGEHDYNRDSAFEPEDEDIQSDGYVDPETSNFSKTNKISDTWIFKSFKVDGSGQYILTEKVPEAFTSYTITGFSIHPEHGLGILSKSITLDAFKQFFVELNVPQSIVMGETLKVEVFVYNYMGRDLNVPVTLLDGDFQIESSCNSASSDKFTRSVQAPKSTVTPVYFYIKPRSIGHLKIGINVKMANVNENASKFILVEDTKVEKINNQAKLIDLRTRRYDGRYFDMKIDETLEKGSVHAEVTIIGNIMGPALQNIEKLM